MLNHVKHVTRGGTYYRVAAPGWHDPLDTKFSKRAGGRWNAAGTFGVLYLNRTLCVAAMQARHYVRHRFGSELDDLQEDARPDLVTVHVPEELVVDCVTPEGVAALGLPPTYPADAANTVITHGVCQAIGQRARDTDERGIACRSACNDASPEDWPGEELVLIDREAPDGMGVSARERHAFHQWYPEALTEGLSSMAVIRSFKQEPRTPH